MYRIDIKQQPIRAITPSIESIAMRVEYNQLDRLNFSCCFSTYFSSA